MCLRNDVRSRATVDAGRASEGTHSNRKLTVVGCLDDHVSVAACDCHRLSRDVLELSCLVLVRGGHELGIGPNGVQRKWLKSFLDKIIIGY